jgi:hypothetical protein
MTNRNQTPNLTAKGKAARRRSRLASAALFLVALGVIALTITVWLARRGA